MKATLNFTYLILIVSGLFYSQPVFGGGGDDHTHAEDKSAPAPAQAAYFSTEISSAKYELLLRYEPLLPGKPAHLMLFVSDFETNRPINEADIKLVVQEDPTLSFSIHQNGNGTYDVEGTFPEKKTYSFAVTINGPSGPDLLLLQHIDVGIELPHEHGNESASWLSSSNWPFLMIALLLGLGLGLLLRRRHTPQGRTTLSAILILIGCSIPFQTTVAHGDDDHSGGASGNVFSNTVAIPKETQFLFDVYTQKIVKGNFTESTKLFGSIIPSSNGQAIVSAPQTGLIKSVQTQVGANVKAGQVLAVIEQYIDAGTQVGFLSEKNNLTAEYEAAQKEVTRLEGIKDIAAKRDIDEAASRLQKAEANLKLMNSNSGKTIVLKSPISGVAGNFNISPGTTVSMGQALFTITNLSTLYAEAQVFDRDADQIVPGALFTIECANDNHKTSEIKLLSQAQEINATNQSQRVLFEVANPDGDFKIGEFVNIRVFEATPSRQITLPNSAITEINGKPVIFLKSTAESYTVSYVQLGHNNGTHTSILKGVEEGQRAVINGSYQLKMIFLNQ